MKIRDKILIYFSSTVIALSAVSLAIIYVLFSEYREEEFQQRQKVKINHTINLLAEFKQMSENLAEMMDRQTIHDFYDEKMLVFDQDKDLIYSSLDNLLIENRNSILQNLSPANRWIETREGKYDVVGLYSESAGKSYYAISKAYDDFGYSKLYFLRNVLITIFVAIALIVIMMSFYLSNIISRPITNLAENLSAYEPGLKEDPVLQTDRSSFELELLTSRFNELLRRTDEAFDFQKNAIHHISHELKTPLAILMSELERIKTLEDPDKMKAVVENQIARAESLGNIINVLLEISKIESGHNIKKVTVRMDELLFDLIEDLMKVNPDFDFDLNYYSDVFDEQALQLPVNDMLMKQALNNLLTNCMAYSDDGRGVIRIDCSSRQYLSITIKNHGPVIPENQQKYLFDHFFRGENSMGKAGFGLGLVLTRRIINLHGGTIVYQNEAGAVNAFEVRLRYATASQQA